MGLRRLLNVFYSMLVETAGGDTEAQKKIDLALLDTTAASEATRRQQAQDNRDALKSLSALFAKG